MNKQSRRKFWNVISNLNDTSEKSVRKLEQVIQYPKTICRFRSVSENALNQLKNNVLYYSTANYYDDPFDTYFYIDHSYIKKQIEFFKELISNNRERIIEFICDSMHNILNTKKEDIHFNMADLLHINLGNFQALAKNARESVLRNLWSICFCDNELNENLWLKYADSYKGFALVYDLYRNQDYLCGKGDKCKSCCMSKFPLSLYPVFYTDNRYNATEYVVSLILVQMLPQLANFIDRPWELEKISLIKKECHHYDDEWRMIFSGIIRDNDRPFIKYRPTQVIIGLKMSEKDQSAIIAAAKTAQIPIISKMVINDNDELEPRVISAI